MSDERDIEKQLRAAAEQRRRAAGAPFALHPATRRLLQGEARRVHGPKTVTLGGKNPIFFKLWLRLASGICTVAILVGATWIFFQMPPPKPAQLAKVEKMRAAEPAGYAQNTPQDASRAPSPSAPAEKPGVNAGFVQSTVPLVVAREKTAAARARADANLDRDQNEIPVVTAKPAVVMPAAPPAMSAPAVAESPGAASGKLAMAEDFPKSLEPQLARNVRFLNNASASTDGGRKADSLASLDVAKSLGNVAGKKSEAAPAGLILNSFQVEQRGDQLRIVDGDGSVYTGQLLAVAGKDKEEQKDDLKSKLADRAETRQVLAGALAGSLQNGQFNAAGTNVSLKQNVVINATFVNGSIVGHAVLANGQSVPLDATPTPTR